MPITTLSKVDAQTVAANLESYLECGCETRAEYLADLADQYDVPLAEVQGMADILGPNEDFDGLITHLEDMGGF